MTRRERTIAAFRGQEVDHVPVCMWKHVPQKYWADEDAFAAFQADAYKATDVDFMKLSGDKYFTCFTLYLVFAPLSCIRLRIGYPRMMEFMREDPEAVKYACSVVAEDQKLLVKGIIEDDGADGIFYSVQNGEEDRFTFDFYRKYVTPGDKEVLDYANSLSDMNAIHFCAWEGVPNRLAVWHDYKAAAVSWSRYMDVMDITEARKLFGCTVWGGFDNRPGSLLYTAGREEIEKETFSLIRQGGKRGYILGSDCSLHGRGLGHTGGTLDKLESIPGCRTSLSEEEFLSQVERVGVAVIGHAGSI